jgi:O-antigen/teichoic acid export membrane protein
MINDESIVVGQEQLQPSTDSSIFRRGVFFTSTGTVITIISLFLETMIAVRMLSTESYGLYVLLIAVVSFFVTIVDFGCKATITQFIARSDPSQKAALVYSTLIFRLFVLAVVSIFIWLAGNLIIYLDPSGKLAQFSIYIPVMLIAASLDELLLAELQGFQTFRQMAIAEIIRSIFRLLLTSVFLVVLHLGVMSLIYSWIISFVLSTLYKYFSLPIPKKILWQLSQLKSLLRFGIPLQVDRILWYLSNRADVLLLGIFVGPVGVAFYNIAVTIPNTLIRLAQSYVSVFYPTMAALIADGKRKQAIWMLDHSLRLCSFAGALTALVTVVFSSQIITLLFSEKYKSSSLAFSLLMIAFHMTFLITLTGYTLTAAGYPKRSLGQTSVNVILTILVDLILIPLIGFIGPAYSQVISTYTANTVSIWLLKRSDIQLTVTHFIKQTVLLWIGVALFWWITPDGYILGLAIIVAYIILNVLLATISFEDFKLMLPDNVISRLKNLKKPQPHH